MVIELTTGPDDHQRRFDRILRKALPDHSLSLIHRLLRQGKALVNGKPAGSEARIPAGACIQVETQLLVSAAADTSRNVHDKIIPAALPEILWRGSGIIIFNKPPGLATHGPGSLDTMVKAWLARTQPQSLSFKPGPLHRLDQPTSGAIAFSETLEGAQWFSRVLREQNIIKTYVAIVEGCLTNVELWQDELSRNENTLKSTVTPGKTAQTAITRIRPLACNGTYSLIEARITTGRTHQIRAQAAFHGYPLAGDVKYGGRRITGSFFLHAWKMKLNGKLFTEMLPPVVATPPLPFLSQVSVFFSHEKNIF